MKRTILAVTAAAALLGLTACVTPAHASTSNDKQFVAAVRAKSSWFNDVSPAVMVKTAKSSCKALRAGLGMGDVVDNATEAGLPYKAATAFVAGSVVYYCPEQADNF